MALVVSSDDDFSLSLNAKKLLNVGPEDFDAILKHYDVKAEAVNDMVCNIQDWYKKQPHLPQRKLHDRRIVSTLIVRLFSIERVKQSIDDYFTARHRIPEFLSSRDPLEPQLAEILRKGYWIVLPKKTVEGHRVSILRVDCSSDDSVAMVLKVIFMFAEYRIFNDVSLGERWILDYKNFTLPQALQVTPVLASKILFYVMSCLGAPFKSAHIINLPHFAIKILNFVKKMLKPKIAERIIVTTKEEVMNFFPKDILPKEYGGEKFTCSEIADEWRRTIQSQPWRQFFIEQNNLFTDESKRLIPSTSDELFGIDGSFRKLTLD